MKSTPLSHKSKTNLTKNHKLYQTFIIWSGFFNLFCWSYGIMLCRTLTLCDLCFIWENTTLIFRSNHLFFILQMYDNIASLCFSTGTNGETVVVAMVSAEGEVLEFKQAIPAEGRVEDWMTAVLLEMRRTNRLITKEAIYFYQHHKSRCVIKVLFTLTFFPWTRGHLWKQWSWLSLHHQITSCFMFIDGSGKGCNGQRRRRKSSFTRTPPRFQMFLNNDRPCSCKVWQAVLGFRRSVNS